MSYWLQFEHTFDSGHCVHRSFIDFVLLFSFSILGRITQFQTKMYAIKMLPFCWNRLNEGKKISIIFHFNQRFSLRKIYWIVFVCHCGAGISRCSIRQEANFISSFLDCMCLALISHLWPSISIEMSSRARFRQYFMCERVDKNLCSVRPPLYG